VPQNTSVGLTIAVAPTSATIPADLVGKTYEAAAAQLTALGLVPVRADVDSDEPVGQVISSEPNRGTTVDIGAEVTLNVSRGAGTDDEGEGDGEGNAQGAPGTEEDVEPVAERSDARVGGAGNGAGNGNGNGSGNNGNGNGNGSRANR
jgi:eukaryotic-like serine/threonine-protein kinase